MKKLIFIFLSLACLDNVCLGQGIKSEKIQIVSPEEKTALLEKGTTTQMRSGGSPTRSEKRKMKREKRRAIRNDRAKRVDYQVGILLSGAEGF